MREYTVYMHISPSNKRYIGITGQEPKKRWANGKHYRFNQYFNNAIEKYGWDNFEHIIIVKGLTEDEAKWLEVELIKEWDTTNREKGYNIGLGGNINPTHSEEVRRKISESKKGEKHPMYGKHLTDEQKEKLRITSLGENNGMYGKFGKDHPKSIAVICLTTMEVFGNAREASEYYSISNHIAKCCKGKRKSCGKLKDGTPLVWMYYKDYLELLMK